MQGNKIFKTIKLSIFVGIIVLLNACGGVFQKGLSKYEAAEYDDAIPLFKQALQSGKVSKAKGNKYIAEAYRSSGRLQESAGYYKAAVEAGTTDPKAKFYYAQSLKATGKYAEALKYFEDYAKTGGDADLKKIALQEVKNKEKYQELLEAETLYEVEHCKGINTEAAEFAPVIHEDKVLFSSSRKNKVYKGTGTGFLGIYEYDLETLKNKGESEADIYEYTLMREGAHDASPTFAHNGKYMIFARSGTGEKMKETEVTNEVDLYITRMTDSGWSEPEMMEVSNPKYWDACPSIHPSGRKLYFASNRKGGYGGLDLYVASLDASGRAFGVKNLGPQINTAGNEMFPVVSNEGILYFSSDGHLGLGQLDLFEAIKKKGKIEIINLGPKMNSPQDDFGLAFETDTTGFFSSNREGGAGDDDIYAFLKKRPKEVPKVVNYFLTVEVLGVDSTKNTYTLEGARVQVNEGTKTNKGKLLHDFLTDKNGKTDTFAIQRPPQDFFIEASKTAYLTEFIDYTTAGNEIPYELLTKPITDTTFLVQLKIPELFLSETFELGINFDFSKHEIRPDAALVLDSVAEVLKENPSLVIELGSHTDAVGSATNNQILSEKRANSTAEYLKAKGIPEGMIKEAVGYGETQLKIDTQRAEERNRRTEIKIVGFKKRRVEEPDKE